MQESESWSEVTLYLGDGAKCPKFLLYAIPSGSLRWGPCKPLLLKIASIVFVFDFIIND